MVVFWKNSLVIAPLHLLACSSQSPLLPCPLYQTEHKEVRSCGSSFSLMLMHILSLLHTNVLWPRLSICLRLDRHLFSVYWPLFKKWHFCRWHKEPLYSNMFLLANLKDCEWQLCLPGKNRVLSKMFNDVFLGAQETILQILFLRGWTSSMLLDHWCGWQNIRFLFFFFALP